LENYRLVPGAYSKILDRIKDELWAELQYSYEFTTLSIWSFNLTKLQFDPKNLVKFQNGPWSIMRYSGQN
jgi:hypothetical protein